MARIIRNDSIFLFAYGFLFLCLYARVAFMFSVFQVLRWFCSLRWRSRPGLRKTRPAVYSATKKKNVGRYFDTILLISGLIKRRRNLNIRHVVRAIIHKGYPFVLYRTSPGVFFPFLFRFRRRQLHAFPSDGQSIIDILLIFVPYWDKKCYYYFFIVRHLEQFLEKSSKSEYNRIVYNMLSI